MKKNAKEVPTPLERANDYEKEMKDFQNQIDHAAKVNVVKNKGKVPVPPNPTLLLDNTNPQNK